MIESSSRMLTLLSLLQGQRDWPGQVLAERLEVTVRTVRRDIDRLRELGYRIHTVKGPHGGYRLAAGSELPPLLFDNEQAVAIAVALQGVSSSGMEIQEAAERALVTIRQVMPSALRHRLDGIRFISSDSAERVDPAVLEAVSTAVRDRKILRFDYGEGDVPPRRTEPHTVLARGGRWYLIGWDLAREDWRLYRLDRMTPRIPAGPLFQRRQLPTPDAGTFLSARFKGSAGADQWPCVGEFIVELSAREIVPWIGDGQIEELTPHSCRVVLGSWSWPGLAAFIARLDAPFSVVGPEPLRAAIAVLADRFAVAGSAPATAADRAGAQPALRA
ncbi:helix-turn-helix transcriptional regulator [Psychromicrobium sp. YIM B11713]|uniref:helix-turn-helix transcriptional regulator n=1 Tax=Psychromicrobium sp. YIM B11713 TaxID=3145233 RepID=UPI00374F558C